MSSNVVIQVEGLSKQYRLGEVSTGSLHHDINRWWHRVRGKEDPYLSVTGVNIRTGKVEKRPQTAGGRERETTEGAENTEGQREAGGSKDLQSSVSSLQSDYVWALRDINFEVKRGEVLGIIGRNGAGKSTLLKILSRITAPTTGEVRIKGRIASLLEVGTGFHQDLTGRENVYLNGAVLGMTRQEIAAKLDEIVEFSGCARYIDTPVKRYSSGMVVRLGFAVAAHLEPEILIVDEVLAVGDAEFQQKCIGKMQDVASHGRTVLFVSHNMGAVRSLCGRACVISEGHLRWTGPTEEAIHHYLTSCAQEQGQSFKFVGSGKDSVELSSILVNGSTHARELLPSDPIIVEMCCQIKVEGYYRFCIVISTAYGIRLFTQSTDNHKMLCGPNKIGFKVESYFLRPGSYLIGVGGSRDNSNWFWADNVTSLGVSEVWDSLNPRHNHGVINYRGEYDIENCPYRNDH